MKFRLFCLTALLPIGLSSQNDDFIQRLKSSIHQMEMTSRHDLDGVGGQLIKDGIAESQFVLIGEAHGIAEVQEFSTALFSQAYQHSYTNAVVETDPFAAEKIQQLAQNDEEASAQFFSEMPMAIPFFYSREGMQMARAVQALGADVNFWGVDQVFVVAPRFLFTQLTKMASDKARPQVEEFKNKSFAAFGQAMQSGSPDQVMLVQMSYEDLDSLEDLFQGNAKALDIIAHMRLSKTIYQHWYDGEYYLNNSVRSKQMKKLFNAYYADAVKTQESPKAVIKLGANHCVRGLTPTRIYDLGNMVAELADINGTGSLHIQLTAARGSSFNMLTGPQSFDATENWHSWLAPTLTTAMETAGDDWLVVDLRPLRTIRLRDADQGLLDLIFGFDLWVIIPQASPVTPYN